MGEAVTKGKERAEILKGGGEEQEDSTQEEPQTKVLKYLEKMKPTLRMTAITHDKSNELPQC